MSLGRGLSRGPCQRVSSWTPKECKTMAFIAVVLDLGLLFCILLGSGIGAIKKHTFGVLGLGLFLYILLGLKVTPSGSCVVLTFCSTERNLHSLKCVIVPDFFWTSIKYKESHVGDCSSVSDLELESFIP